MSNPVNYTKYLKYPKQKKAFLAGCKAMAAIVKTANSDDVTFLVSNPSDDRILSLVLDQQDVEHNIQHHDAATIIEHSSLKESEAAAMVLGFMVNDTGYATDETGYVVEDGHFQLQPGKAYRPWPYVLAQHKQTGAQITAEEYANLALEQQQGYELLRYLDLQNDQDVVLKRVIENDEVYMAELLRYSIGNGRDNSSIFRYLCECGSGHDELPRGRFYDYRKEIATAAQKLGLINKMLATQISEGYVNTLGQYYLAWLQTLNVTLKPSSLLDMTAYQMAILKILLTTNTDEMAYDITDADVRLYRDVNGNGMRGSVYYEGCGANNWHCIPAFDPACDIAAQKNYICNTLIPRAKNAIIMAADRTFSKDDLIDMDARTLSGLMELVKAIDPEFFEDDCAGCEGCEGCEGNPAAIEAAREASAARAAKPVPEPEDSEPPVE